MRGGERLLRGALRHLERIEVGDVGRVGVLPSGRIRTQHGDGNFRQSLGMPLAETPRIENALNGFRTGKDAGGCELVLLRNLNNLLYTLGAKLGRDGGGLGEETCGHSRGGGGGVAPPGGGGPRMPGGGKITVR